MFISVDSVFFTVDSSGDDLAECVRLSVHMHMWVMELVVVCVGDCSEKQELNAGLYNGTTILPLEQMRMLL
uniref:Uncharacterized protein n=1 Tax=Arion vulgaris TaxID=1028688 RepID=A0A0B7BFI1_9EUPU